LDLLGELVQPRIEEDWPYIFTVIEQSTNAFVAIKRGLWPHPRERSIWVSTFVPN